MEAVPVLGSAWHTVTVGMEDGWMMDDGWRMAGGWMNDV